MSCYLIFLLLLSTHFPSQSCDAFLLAAANKTVVTETSAKPSKLGCAVCTTLSQQATDRMTVFSSDKKPLMCDNVTIRYRESCKKEEVKKPDKSKNCSASGI